MSDSSLARGTARFDKRLAMGALCAVLAVLATSALGLVLAVQAHDEEQQHDSEVAAKLLAHHHIRDANATRMLLQHVCESDVRVERLALELAAEGEPEASRLARGLAPGLEAEVWLLHERAGQLRVLGASGAQPARLPSTEALSEALTRERAVSGPEAIAISACLRRVRNDVLWVVRAEALEVLRDRLAEAVSGSLSWASEHGDQRSGVDVLRIDGSDGAPAHTLRVRVNSPAHLSSLVAFLPLLALAIVSCGGLVYLFSTRAKAEETVLVELEQAAERVAKGDLSARITARVGGRADQTFRTFDRMTEELSEMRARLAEAERAAAWQDMARRIAHEIKNPLSPIQMAIETLRKAHQKRLPAFDEIFDESTRAILEEVRRMEHIVREFSEFARLPRARPGVLALDALVADTLSLYQPADVHVELTRPVNTLLVRADREQITQVLVNLLQNAIDAARTSAHPRVALRVEARADAALVHVDDNGEGVALDLRERVFEPYFTTKQHGTGLGLSIVRRIALDHEGAVSVTASPLGGARFTLRLPLGESS